MLCFFIYKKKACRSAADKHTVAEDVWYMRLSQAGAAGRNKSGRDTQAAINRGGGKTSFSRGGRPRWKWCKVETVLRKQTPLNRRMESEARYGVARPVSRRTDPSNIFISSNEH